VLFYSPSEPFYNVKVEDTELCFLFPTDLFLFVYIAYMPILYTCLQITGRYDKIFDIG